MLHLKKYRLLALVLTFAYVLSACSGVPAGVGGPSSQEGKNQEVVFSGTVESIAGNVWTVSGQTVSLSGSTALDVNIQVGDNVKVEAVVDQNGAVTALSIESAGSDDNANANSNEDNTNTVNSNDGNANGNENDNASNSNDDNPNSSANSNDTNEDVSLGSEQEVSGIVEVITTDSVTINGVVYQIADFTEFKDLITVGDNVKVHVIVNADGTLTIREIEKSAGIEVNDNSNSNGSDDNSNSNDDPGNDNNSGGNDNDDDNDNGNDGGNGDDDEDDDNDNNSGSNNNG